MVAVLSALGAALMYALASVLQQRGAAAEPDDQSLRLSMLARLARKPMWLLGVACDVVGYGLQFLALGHGPIVVVQPVLVCGLLFALPLGAALAGRRLYARDWLAAVLVCAGLAAFLIVAAPHAGHNDVAPLVWTLLLTTSALTVGLLLMAGRRRSAWQRAVLYSGAAGVIYGGTAALTKTSAHLLGGGLVHLLEAWQPWVMLAAGVIGMVVAQSAFQAGGLDVSLPAMSVVDPVVSVVIGAVAFGESIASRPAAVAVELAALIAMSAGVTLLARGESGRSLQGHAQLSS